MSAPELTATTVRVTRQHIDAGKPGDACRCAFALAVIDAIDNEGIQAWRVDVDGPGGGKDWRTTAHLDEDERSRVYAASLPRSVVDWILDFDEGEPVQPFEVQLNWELAS